MKDASPKSGASGRAESAAGLTVSHIESLSELDSIRAEWEHLSRHDTGSGLFLSYPWIRLLLKDNPDRWRVFTVRDEGQGNRLVCLFPASYDARRSDAGRAPDVRIGAAGRFSLSDRTGFLCDTAYAEAGPAALGRWLAGAGFGRFSLRYEPTRDRADAFAGAVDARRYRVSWKSYFINDGRTNYLISPTIHLPESFDAYLSERLGASTRRSMRRAMRTHLDSGDCRISTATDETLDRDLGVLEELWCAQWAAEYDADELRRSVRRHREFYLLANRLGALRVSVLWRGAQPLGAQACVVDRAGGEMFAKQGARVLGESLPIGNLLLLHETRWAIDNGLRRFDLGHGDAPYKYSLGAVDREVLYVSIRPRSVKRA